MRTAFLAHSALVSVLVACAGSAPPPPLIVAVVDTVAAEPVPPPPEPEASLEERWRSPFAVESRGRARPMRSREIVVISADSTIALALARADSSRSRQPDPVAAAVAGGQPREADLSDGAGAPPANPRASAEADRAGDRDPADVPSPTREAELPPAGSDRATTTHQVVQGDTWLGIVARYRISSDELQRLNPGVDRERIRIGQTLVISTATAVPTAGNVHVVEAGESLWAISRRYGVSIDQIRAANDLDSDRIRQGQRLRIPLRQTDRQ